MGFASLLLQIHLRAAVGSDFLWIWFLCLIFAVIGGAWAGGRSEITPENEQEAEFWPRLDTVDVAAAGLFATFAALYIAVIFYKEDFAYYDGDQLMDFSVRGVSFAPPIWPAEGRFFPLAFQEFNLLRFVTRSPVGYHLFAVIQLAIVLAILFFVLREFRLRYRVVVISAAMLAPGFCIAFGALIYPERNLLFWLAVLILCAAGYEKRKTRVYLIGCLTATQFLLYYKEIVVILIAAFALTYALLKARFKNAPGRFSSLRFASENSLPLGMLALSAIYSLLFRILLPAHGTFSYVREHQETLASVLRTYLVIDWVAWIVFAVFVIRFARAFLSRRELEPLWDSLAAGAIAYFLSILALRLISAYYLAPVDFIGLLYLARLSLAWLKAKPGKQRRLAIGIVLVLVMLHDAAYSSFRTVERKGLIEEKAQLADFLSQYARTQKASQIEMFFPYSQPYNLMILAAYLKYKGFGVDASPLRAGQSDPEIVLESPGPFINSRCVEYREYTCIHKDRPGAGALVVVMPDDNIGMNGVDALEEHESLVFLATGPAPRVTTNSWFRMLYAVSPQFAATGVPGHWLRLHVFRVSA